MKKIDFICTKCKTTFPIDWFYPRCGICIGPLELEKVVTESSFDLSELKDELLEWEGVYNTVRPHQALGYLTPPKFLERWKEYSGKEDVSLII